MVEHLCIQLDQALCWLMLGYILIVIYSFRSIFILTVEHLCIQLAQTLCKLILGYILLSCILLVK